MMFISELFNSLHESFVGNFGPEFPSMYVFITVLAA